MPGGDKTGGTGRSAGGRAIPGRPGQVTAGGRGRAGIQAVNTVSQNRRTGETGANTFSSRFGGVMAGPRLVN